MELKLKSPKYGEKTVLIDKEDYPTISKHRWNISFVRGNWYAVTTAWDKKRKKLINTKLHRLIMGVCGTPKIHIDHKDGNGLNNQKENLRKATNAQNQRNVGVNKKNTTGYKGVFLYKPPHRNAGRYTATIKTDNGKIHGGYFNTAIEAAVKYNEMALKYHGEFANLNIIDKNELEKAKYFVKPIKTATLPSSHKTGFRGVTISKGRRKKKYRATIRINNIPIYLGNYQTAKEAAIKYNEAVLKYKPNKATLNLIDND